MDYNCPNYYSKVFATTLGQNLWDFLNEPETIAGMQQVSDQERPAVEFLEQGLPDHMRQEIEGASDRDRDTIKRMIGHMVEKVLERHDYRFLSSDHPVRGDLFEKGSRYVRNANSD